jgi:hypothetical protein
MATLQTELEKVQPVGKPPPIDFVKAANRKSHVERLKTEIKFLREEIKQLKAEKELLIRILKVN